MDVAVLGAGATGLGVAQVCVLAGHDVSLWAGEANAVMDGVDTIERRIAAGDADTGFPGGPMDRLDATTGLDAAAGSADVVVEATGADVESVRATFADVEARAGDGALIATAAAGVSVTAAAAGLQQPSRSVGLRFRDPLASPLVEVVAADQTAGETTDRATAFVEGLDRHPILVRDTPGAVTARLALATEVEAMRLVDEGVAGVTAVDDGLVLGYDHPEGPLERADRAGLDARLETYESLAGSLGERFAPPPVLAELVDAGRTGADTGEGFYVWENGEPVEPGLPAPEIPPGDVRRDEPGI